MANYKGTANRVGKGMDEMMELVGDAGLVRAFVDMRDSSVRSIMRPALQAGASIASKEAKRLVPVDERRLKKSIGVQVKTSKRKGTVHAKIHVRRGFEKDGQDPVNYAHLIEFGTGPRVQKTTGRRVGAIAPRPFLRRALSNKRAQIQSVIVSRSKTQLRKLARKAAVKGKVL
jgi:HK97 gp10 family phage protein